MLLPARGLKSEVGVFCKTTKTLSPYILGFPWGKLDSAV